MAKKSANIRQLNKNNLLSSEYGLLNGYITSFKPHPKVDLSGYTSLSLVIELFPEKRQIFSHDIDNDMKCNQYFTSDVVFSKYQVKVPSIRLSLYSKVKRKDDKKTEDVYIKKLLGSNMIDIAPLMQIENSTIQLIHIYDDSLRATGDRSDHCIGAVVMSLSYLDTNNNPASSSDNNNVTTTVTSKQSKCLKLLNKSNLFDNTLFQEHYIHLKIASSSLTSAMSEYNLQQYRLFLECYNTQTGKSFLLSSTHQGDGFIEWEQFEFIFHVNEICQCITPLKFSLSYGYDIDSKRVLGETTMLLASDMLHKGFVVSYSLPIRAQKNSKYYEEGTKIASITIQYHEISLRNQTTFESSLANKRVTTGDIGTLETDPDNELLVSITDGHIIDLSYHGALQPYFELSLICSSSKDNTFHQQCSDHTEYSIENSRITCNLSIPLPSSVSDNDCYYTLLAVCRDAGRYQYPTLAWGSLSIPTSFLLHNAVDSPLEYIEYIDLYDMASIQSGVISTAKGCKLGRYKFTLSIKPMNEIKHIGILYCHFRDIIETRYSQELQIGVISGRCEVVDELGQQVDCQTIAQSPCILPITNLANHLQLQIDNQSNLLKPYEGQLAVQDVISQSKKTDIAISPTSPTTPSPSAPQQQQQYQFIEQIYPLIDRYQGSTSRLRMFGCYVPYVIGRFRLNIRSIDRMKGCKLPTNSLTSLGGTAAAAGEYYLRVTLDKKFHSMAKLKYSLNNLTIAESIVLDIDIFEYLERRAGHLTQSDLLHMSWELLYHSSDTPGLTCLAEGVFDTCNLYHAALQDMLLSNTTSYAFQSIIPLVKHELQQQHPSPQFHLSEKSIPQKVMFKLNLEGVFTTIELTSRNISIPQVTMNQRYLLFHKELQYKLLYQQFDKSCHGQIKLTDLFSAMEPNESDILTHSSSLEDASLSYLAIVRNRLERLNIYRMESLSWWLWKCLIKSVLYDELSVDSLVLILTSVQQMLQYHNVYHLDQKALKRIYLMIPKQLLMTFSNPPSSTAASSPRSPSLRLGSSGGDPFSKSASKSVMRLQYLISSQRDFNSKYVEQLKSLLKQHQHDPAMKSQIQSLLDSYLLQHQHLMRYYDATASSGEGEDVERSRSNSQYRQTTTVNPSHPSYYHELISSHINNQDTILVAYRSKRIKVMSCLARIMTFLRRVIRHYRQRKYQSAHRKLLANLTRFLYRCKYLKYRNLMRGKIVQLQRLIRGYLARRRLAVQQQAVKTLQSVYRRYRNHQLLREKTFFSIVQMARRRLSAMRKINRGGMAWYTKKKRNEAAKRLQRNYHSFRLSKEIEKRVTAKRNHRLKCLMIVMNFLVYGVYKWRRFRQRRQLEKERLYRRYLYLITKVQARIRCRLARLRARRLREEIERQRLEEERRRQEEERLRLEAIERERLEAIMREKRRLKEEFDAIFNPSNIFDKPVLADTVGYHFTWEDSKCKLYAKVIDIKRDLNNNPTKNLQVQFYDPENDYRLNKEVESFNYSTKTGKMIWYMSLELQQRKAEERRKKEEELEKERKKLKEEFDAIFNPSNLVEKPALADTVGYYFTWEDPQCKLYAVVTDIKCDFHNNPTKHLFVHFYDPENDYRLSQEVESFNYSTVTGTTLWYKPVQQQL